MDSDTDISSYTNDELLEILGLDSHTYTESLINEKVTFMKARYPTLSFFFSQLKERLYGHELEEGGEEGGEEGEEGGEGGEEGGEGGGDHEIIKQEYKPAIHTNAPTVLQGKLNPTIKNTVTRIVVLDSAFRQNILPHVSDNMSAPSCSTDYTLDLSDTLKNTVSLKLASVHIPYTWYTIADYLGNDRFGYITDINVDTLPTAGKMELTGTVSVTADLYTSVSALIDNLNSVSAANKLKDDSFDLSFSLEGRNVSITNNHKSKTIRVVFFNTINPNLNPIPLKNNGNLKIDNNLGWVLGFRGTNIELNTHKDGLVYDIPAEGMIIGEALVFLPNPTYLLLVVDDFNQNRLNNGIVNINRSSSVLSTPSYINSNVNFAVTNTDNGFNTQYRTYLPNVSDTVKPIIKPRLTQAQLYTANQISANRMDTTSTRLQGPTTTDVLAVIPLKMSSLNFGDMYIEFGSSLLQNERTYFGPVYIDKMRVRLCDNKGNTLNLNGANWSISLITSHLYEY